MKALVIVGGLPQAELLIQLKCRGIITVLIDGNDKAIARPYADVFYQVDIFDIDEVKKIAIRDHVDFIITVCADQVLLVVAQVSEALGLPYYIDYKTAQNVSDKLKMKAIFKENGIPTSDYVQLTKLDADFFANLHFPFVIKPGDAYSSKGVRKIENIRQFKQFYHEAKEISRTGEVIAEEYVDGEEISVDAFVLNGKVKILCISNSEKIKDDGRFIIFRGRYPAHASEEIVKQIKNVTQQIADAFHLKNSPMLVQMINTGTKVSVIEFCARTGGNMKWLLIKHSCGVDVISATIDLVLGIRPQINPEPNMNKYVVNDFIYCYPGVFSSLKGFEELKKQGVLTEYFAIRPQGTKIQAIHSSSDRVAGFTVTAKTFGELNEKHRKIVNTVKVLDVDGNDIMRHDLLPDIV